MDNFNQLFVKALAAAAQGKKGAVISRQDAMLMGSHARGIAEYKPFHELHLTDQQRVRSMYPHKAVGGKYDFRDEHYFYPVNKLGRLFQGRGARRSLGLSYDAITSGEVEKFGYKKNPGW
jgi:hypothetical protein